MSTYLPEDVVLKILSRLPTKSQIRFRCVSKTWHEIIGNPDFVSKNLLNDSILTTTQENPNHPLLLVKYTRKRTSFKEVLCFLSYETLECEYHISLPGLMFAASCKGLLCLGSYYRSGSNVYVWNPATPSVGLKRLPPLSCPRRSFRFGLGFGYDSRSNDFKAVSIRIIDFGRAFPQTNPGYVEVCSLSGGSWRVLDQDVLPPFKEEWVWRKSRPPVALDGIFIWWLPEHNIAAFDFTDEVLRTTPLPDGGRLSDYDYFDGSTITFLNGNVSLLAFSGSKMNEKCDLEIWVLLEFGVEESWTRLTTIGLSIDLERPLGFCKRGELLMENSEGQLVLYDLFTHTTKILQVDGSKRTFQIVLHSPSSVAVEGGVNSVRYFSFG